MASKHTFFLRASAPYQPNPARPPKPASVSRDQLMSAAEHAFPPGPPASSTGGPVGPVPNSPSMSPGSPADLAMGAFSDAAPWDLTGKPLPWRTGIEQLRAETGDRVPKLLRKRRLPPGRRVLVTTLTLGGPSSPGASWTSAERTGWAAGRYHGLAFPGVSERRSSVSGRRISSSANPLLRRRRVPPGTRG